MTVTNKNVEIDYDYKVDSKDPTKKKKKRAGAGAGVGSGAAEGGAVIEDDGGETGGYSLAGCNYVEDPELLVGFPDEEQEYETSNCLQGINDDFIKTEKARKLKAKKKGGMKNVMYGDEDFDAEEVG